MFAPGAIACAYWTSRSVSAAQPAMSELVGSKGGTGPAGWMIVNFGGSGRPKAVSKVFRSASAVGLPNESTIAIVVPLPVRPLA